jgi:hypothetical protein
METLTCRTGISEFDQSTENLPEERRVERMNDTSNYESRLWKLLEEKKLADLSQFHQQGFFDEVPLYSRESDVAFLPDDDNEANEILLRFALKFLKSVIAYEQHAPGYVAAITLWDYSDARFVPNLFVWHAPLRELKEKLVLKAVTTPFGKKIKKLSPRLKLRNQFEVLEDHSTVPDATRVFLGPVQPPYRGFVTLDRFRRPERVSK